MRFPLDGYRWTHHAQAQLAPRQIPLHAVAAALSTRPVVQTAIRAYHVWSAPGASRRLVVCVAYHPPRILTCFWRLARSPLPLARWRAAGQGSPGRRLRRRPRISWRTRRRMHLCPARVRIVQARCAFRLDPPARPGPGMPRSD